MDPPQLNTHRRYSFCFNTLELSCTCISRALAYHKKQTPVSLFGGYLDLQRKTYVDIQHVQNDTVYHILYVYMQQKVEQNIAYQYD